MKALLINAIMEEPDRWCGTACSTNATNIDLLKEIMRYIYTSIVGNY
jgi:hypothetical protein